jgi:predicted TIM-barrel fold metal-dependent hydrolase
VLVDSAYIDKSPAHIDYEPFWAQLAEANVPFMTHIGTGGPLVPKAFRNNGRPVPKDWLGGGENIRSKDYVGIGHWPYTFFSMMALDGVFEKFPNLRGASIEQGAEWVPMLLRALDHAHNLFSKNEPDLRALPMKASEYIRRQVKFTPFPKEDVRWVIENVGPDLLMFSTDYPHLEGGHDPLKNFSRNLEGMPDDVLDRFYARNFAELMNIDVQAIAA